MDSEVEASLTMGETKYNPVAKHVMQTPAVVDFHKVTLVLTV